MDLINNLVFNNELEALRRENKILQQTVRHLNANIFNSEYDYSFAFMHKRITDLSNYDMNKCQIANYMFYRALPLSQGSFGLDWNLDNLEYANYMFHTAEVEYTLNTSNWTLKNLKYANNMFNTFSENTMFRMLDTSNFDLSNLLDGEHMFSNMSEPISNSSSFNFNTSKFNLSNLLNGNYMFENINIPNNYSNSIFDTSNWNLSNLVNGDGMFSNLHLKIKSNVDTSNWDLSNLRDAVEMFAGSNIEELNFSSWKKPHERLITMGIFRGCSNLTKLTAYGAVLKKLTTNASTYSIDDTKLYKCTGEVLGDNGFFTIEGEPEEV